MAQPQFERAPSHLSGEGARAAVDEHQLAPHRVGVRQIAARVGGLGVHHGVGVQVLNFEHDTFEINF